MPYFEIEDLRALPSMGDSDKYPDARITAVHDALVSIVEREVQTTFVPTSVTESISGSYPPYLILASPYVESITSVTVDGDAVDPSLLSLHDGVVRYLDGTSWATSGVDVITVTYVSAYPGGVPADLKEALLWATRDRLLATSSTAGIDARRTSLVTEQGTVNYILPGEDRPTGYPDLDAAILNWREAIRVPSVS